MITKKIFLLSALLIFISLIGTCILYPQLPAEIAIHFNSQGVADGFTGKEGIFFTALLPVLLLGLFFIVPKIDPRKASYEKHQQVYRITIFSILVFMLIIHWIIVLTALEYAISVEKVIPILVGVLFIILGNYLPRIHSNYTFGIRTPWALENTDNWKKTQRVGGYCFILSGILIIIESLFFTPLTVLFWFSIVLIVVVPYLVSYLEYKKKL